MAMPIAVKSERAASRPILRSGIIEPRPGADSSAGHFERE
jgi:hypothetical protein